MQKAKPVSFKETGRLFGGTFTRIQPGLETPRKLDHNSVNVNSVKRNMIISVMKKFGTKEPVLVKRAEEFVSDADGNVF